MPDTISTAAITFIVSQQALKEFSQILQRGFFIRIKTGRPLEEVLVEQMGIEKRYVEEQLSTIFLDGQPVDDLHTAVVHDGSTLSLSAAMPGLAGASMRRKGVYASFRSTIAYREKGGTDAGHEGSIEVKLFNLVMIDLGPHFFKRGIYLRSDTLAEFLTSMTVDIRTGCRLILLGNRPVPGDAVAGILKNMGTDMIEVFVICQKDVVF
ncbi:MAG: hypothetical protein A4E64_02408 [Syntrophorhabdus sp. PtaU1.Bin058]|nr:MAG: hypothetical protein A4E64_02408 [Syntrophorhabdus sp. PtaU1.Bin058]